MIVIDCLYECTVGAGVRIHRITNAVKHIEHRLFRIPGKIRLSKAAIAEGQ
jgi:hypothetical protein